MVAILKIGNKKYAYSVRIYMTKIRISVFPEIAYSGRGAISISVS